MAKKALVQKAAKKPKFAVRGYTRCNRCGRPARGVPHVRPLPHLRARDGARRTAPRRHQVLLVVDPSVRRPCTARGDHDGKATGLHT
jgi:hypothetical protein